ncbi:MAG: hypothetical protein ABSF83_10185 [Nitrososphaerales archaeon]|jgi:hypothetical protein
MIAAASLVVGLGLSLLLLGPLTARTVEDSVALLVLGAMIVVVELSLRRVRRRVEALTKDRPYRPQRRPSRALPSREEIRL